MARKKSDIGHLLALYKRKGWSPDTVRLKMLSKVNAKLLRLEHTARSGVGHQMTPQYVTEHRKNKKDTT